MNGKTAGFLESGFRMAITNRDRVGKALELLKAGRQRQAGDQSSVTVSTGTEVLFR